MVKDKDYKGAAAASGNIYAKYKNFAAGYNQAVLTEATEGTAKAVGLMESLAKAFPDNAEAQSTLKGMQSRNASNQAAAAQLSQ
jgi:threonine synthase